MVDINTNPPMEVPGNAGPTPQELQTQQVDTSQPTSEDPTIIEMLDPDGNITHGPVSAIQGALGAGYKFIPGSKEESAYKQYGEGMGPSKAALLGAARGVSFGTSDWGLTRLGIMKPEEIKGFEDYNPTASALGEVGGVGASLLLGPEVAGEKVLGEAAHVLPTSLASKLGETVGKTTAKVLTSGSENAGKMLKGAGDILGSVADNAVQGALYGATTPISEAALKDPDAAGEYLMSHLGPSMLFGAEVGGALGLGGELVSKTISKGISSFKKPPGPLQDVADVLNDTYSGLGKEARALGIDFSDVTKQLTGKMFVDVVSKASPSELDELGGKFREAHDSMISKSKDLINEIKDMPAPDLTFVPKSKFDNLTDSIKSELGRLDTNRGVELLEKGLAAKEAPDYGNILEHFNSQLENATNAEEVVKVLRDFQDTVKNKEGLGHLVKPIQDTLENKDIMGPYAAIYNQKDAAINHWVESSTTPAMDNYAPIFKDPSKMEPIANLIDATRRLDEVYSELHQWDPRHQIGKDGVSLFQNSTTKVGKMIDGLKAGNPFAAISIGSGILHHPGLAGVAAVGELGRQYLKSRTGQQLANIQKLTDKMTKSIEDSVKGIGALQAGKIQNKVMDIKDYEEHMDRLNQLNHPERMIDELHSTVSPLYDHFPIVSRAAAKTYTQQIQQLQGTRPAPKPTQMLNGLKPTPNRAEIGKFSNTVALLNDPVTLIDKVKNGTITSSDVKTIATVYPKLYAEMQEKVMSHLAGLEDPHKIPYRTKVALSTFLGSPMTNSQTPQHMQQAQAVLTGASNQKQAQENTAKTSTKGMQKLSIGQRLQTPLQSDRLEKS